MKHLREEARLAVALIWNQSGPHPESRQMPTPLLESWLKDAWELRTGYDLANKMRDVARVASQRDLEAKRITERLLIDSRNIQEAEKKTLIAAVEKNSTLRTHVKLLREALEKIRRTPVKPFPDSAAHSERAFSNAVWEAWSDIQRKAQAALDATKGEG